MIVTTVVIISVGSFIGGLIAAHKPEARPRCSAHGSSKEWSGNTTLIVNHHCKERADPRCVGIYCAPHCREPLRCKGACIDSDIAARKNV